MEIKRMTGSTYKIMDLVGTSEKSFEEAIQNVVTTAAKTVRNLRIAEVVQLDCKIDKQKIVAYRALVRLSFKVEGEESEDDKDLMILRKR